MGWCVGDGVLSSGCGLEGEESKAGGWDDEDDVERRKGGLLESMDVTKDQGSRSGVELSSTSRVTRG